MSEAGKREDAEQRMRHTLVKGHGRIWEGTYNLPGWERQRRNSHGFVLVIWEIVLPRHLLLTSKSYINFILLLLRVYTLRHKCFFSFCLGWFFWWFCCLGAFFFNTIFLQVRWKDTLSVQVNNKTCKIILTHFTYRNFYKRKLKRKKNWIIQGRKQADNQRTRPRDCLPKVCTRP